MTGTYTVSFSDRTWRLSGKVAQRWDRANIRISFRDRSETLAAEVDPVTGTADANDEASMVGKNRYSMAFRPQPDADDADQVWYKFRVRRTYLRQRSFDAVSLGASEDNDKVSM